MYFRVSDGKHKEISMPWLLETAVLVLGVVVAFMALIVAGMLHLIGDLSRRLGPDQGVLVPKDGLEIGVVAPPLRASELRSKQFVDLAEFAGRPAVVAFLSPTCGPCKQLAPDLDRVAMDRKGIPFIVVAASGTGVDYAKVLGPHVYVVGDPDRILQDAYEVSRVPLVYAIDPEGKIAMRGITNNALDLEDTLDGIGHHQGSAWIPASLADETSTVAG